MKNQKPKTKTHTSLSQRANYDWLVDNLLIPFAAPTILLFGEAPMILLFMKEPTQRMSRLSCTR